MPDFTLFTPLEILSDILSHVNQVDCVECMFVCRRWYKLIPQYGDDVWENLEISEKSWPKSNNAMLKCLGTHVKEVSINNHQNSNKILQRLKRQGCDIQFLDIKGGFEARNAELDPILLLGGVGFFRKTLKELYIRGSCNEFLSLSSLLNLLPVLTHLTINLSFSIEYIPSEYDQSISEEMQQNIQKSNGDVNNNDEYNLILLCLASKFRCCNDIKHVLKRSPRLKYLVITRYTIYKYMEVPSVTFASIFELCPSLRYISFGEQYYPREIQEKCFTLSRRRNMNNSDNKDYEKRKSNHLRQVRFYSDDEQQHISALKAILQQPSMLEQLHLSGSYHVDLYQIWNKFTQRNSNMLLQPSQLKSLELVQFGIIYETENNISFEDFFAHFQHIEKLEIDFYVKHGDNFEKEKECMRKVVEAIGHQLHQLRYLYLGFVRRNFCGIYLCHNVATTLCDWNQELESLHLHNVFISKDMLLDLCHHPKLHTLTLSGYEVHEQLTKDGWISFTSKLKELEENNNSKIQTISLACDFCDNVTDEVLEAFACVKSLKTLRIERNRAISDAGVNKFESIKSNISKKHKKIELYHCENVSSDNPHVVFVSSTFS